MRNEIFSRLDNCINDIFIECQNKMGIAAGDVDPMDEIKLNRLINELADHITDILEKQKEV